MWTANPILPYQEEGGAVTQVMETSSTRWRCRPLLRQGNMFSASDGIASAHPRSGLFAAIYWSCRPQQLIITIIVGSKEKTWGSSTFPANHCSQLNWVKGPVKKHLKWFQIISYFYRHFILLGEGDQLSYIANGLNQSASSATQPQTIIRT